MKRKLLKQIRAEWRSNLWLGLELVIVSVVLWYICTQAGMSIYAVAAPSGVDVENVYRISLESIGPDEEGYTAPIAEGLSPEEAAEAVSARKAGEFKELLARLRERPEIEEVAYGNFGPYSLSFFGMGWLVAETAGDSLPVTLSPNTLYVSPEYPLVFGIRGAAGETPEQMAAVLRSGRSLLTSNASERLGMTEGSLVNLKLMTDPQYGDVRRTTVGAVIPPIKRSDYEYPRHQTLYVPAADPSEVVYFSYDEVYVKARPGQDASLARKLKKELGRSPVGNLYVLDVKPFSAVRDTLQREDRTMLRNLLFCVFFLMATVFLGLLGTFWFRTQQRVKEIAVRKVAGATDGNIFRRLMGEGMIVLAASTVVALAADAWLTWKELNPANDRYHDDIWEWTFVTAGAVFLLMALTIVAGIYFPARKAMKVEPAEILRGE